MPADPSDSPGGMLRRMVQRVAAPGRERGPSGDAPSSLSAADAERAELKAMIERKRRNDFVRKRELDMLRRIRREGLTPEQAASLAASSRLDDESEARATQPPGPSDLGVKAKIDAIEKQMVGTPGTPVPPPPLVQRPGPRPAGHVQLPTLTQSVDAVPTVPADLDLTEPRPVPPPPVPPAPPVAPPPVGGPRGADGAFDWADTVAPEPTAPASAPASAPVPTAEVADLPAMEVNEIAHDIELDEAVIAFANAEFSHCETTLTRLIGPQGSRLGHPDTWLVLFDLYRATGQQLAFEALATPFSERFQRSPPQWFSLPRLVAEATRSGLPRQRDTHSASVGWVCPPNLDADAVSQLASQSLQLPQPWVLDWGLLQRVDVAGAVRLHTLMRQWGEQTLDMHWLGADRLLATLQDAAPVGVRDADPAFWLARMEALRLANRPDQFDDVAIDYCVTFEVSPPSWAPSRCVARIGGAPMTTRSAALSAIGDAVTTLQDMQDGRGTQAVTTLELMGQLAGDIQPLLDGLSARLGSAQVVRISCALLIRADFLAAGDLLNWVLARKAEGRQVGFTDVHRLVALMFRAMGLTDQAPVQLRAA